MGDTEAESPKGNDLPKVTGRRGGRTKAPTGGFNGFSSVTLAPSLGHGVSEERLNRKGQVPK